MWTSVTVLSICLSTFASELELFNHNGWIPVNSDIVYNQIRHGITHPPQFTKADDVQVLNTNILSFIPQQDYNSVLTEENTLGDHIEKKTQDPNNIGDILKYNPHLLLKNNIVLKSFQPSIKQNLKADESIRRSKKLSNIDSHLLLNSKLPKNNHELITVKNFLKMEDIVKIEDKFTEDDAHTYEVTENDTIEDRKQEESAVKERGYEYNPPNKQNFTNGLIKHLFKYDTKNVDNLQNYALSRRTKTASLVTTDYPLNRLHFREPIRYNSLNHLPVDPLLAVLLSNYGHYLQGQYGIQNNYNNLYGYLASNNIHNNRPFGFYKLFSDTDASNK